MQISSFAESSDMFDGIKISAELLLSIVPQIIILTIFINRLDSRIKSNEQVSDLKFLALTERMKEVEQDLKEKTASNSRALEALTTKYDVLNKEVLNKLFDIEKVLERLKGQLGIGDHPGGPNFRG